MNHCAVSVAPEQPGRKSVKEPAEKFSARLVRPPAPTAPDEFIVSQIQSDRASDQKTVEAEGFFREWKRADQTIDHIVFSGVAPNVTSGPIWKDRLAPGRKSARTRRLRKRVAQTKFINFVAGFFPLLGQFEPNASGAQPRVPRKIHNAENAKRFFHDLFTEKIDGPRQSKIYVAPD
jgi:hypothetical protein